MVYVLLAPGFEESEAVVPTDLLRQAGLETALVSLSGPTVSGSHGITLCADLELSQVDLSNAEMLVLPGGLGGVEALWADDRVSALIQEAAGKGGWPLCAPPPSFWGAGGFWTAGRPPLTPPATVSWARPRSFRRPVPYPTGSSSPAMPAAPPSTSA